MKNHPWVAAVLNFFLPGSGYLYVGKRKFFGVAVFIYTLFTYYIVFFQPSNVVESTKPSDIVAFFVLLLLLLGYSYDAYQLSVTANSEMIK